MRADRLVGIILVMQARGQVTAASIAEEFEVSVATARRDFEALSAAGIPVYPQAGRGGGWSLLGGARTDLSGLSSAEAQSLFLLLGPAASIAPDAKSALRKLIRALPSTFRADAEAAADAVVIDPTRWGSVGRQRSPLVEVLQSAVIQRRRVRLAYTNWAREQTRPLVDPWGLTDKDGVWYFLGGVDGGQRTFRVDRIADAVVTDEAADRPTDFELSEAWQGVVGEVEQQRSRVSATVLISAELLPVLRGEFGRQCLVEGAADADPVQVRVSAPALEVLAGRLAGWGALVDVLEPASVRNELARIGYELTARYGG